VFGVCACVLVDVGGEGENYKLPLKCLEKLLTDPNWSCVPSCRNVLEHIVSSP
jgi:hypothetical protein